MNARERVNIDTSAWSGLSSDRRTIDITPISAWQRAVRMLTASAFLAMVLPILLLLGGMVLLGVLASGIAFSAWMVIRSAERSHRGHQQYADIVDLR